MLEERLILERQRTAWGVVIASFCVFVTLCFAIPLSVTAFLQNAMQDLNLFVQANQGTVGIDNRGGDTRAVIVGSPGQALGFGEHVLTGSSATALIAAHLPDSEQVLATFHVYSNTDFHLVTAETPRFGLSDHDRVITVRLDNGRIRVNLLEDASRPLHILLLTPHGEIHIADQGQYAVVVTAEDTQTTVQEGVASIVAQEQTLVLQQGTRGRILADQAPEGPLGTERNLVANGDFRRNWEQWILNPWIVDLAAQPEGQVQVFNLNGLPRLNIARQGVGHAEVSLRQSINQDVSELTSLRLLFTFRVLEQSLGVCGVKGSECPFFVRINYVDENGASNTWQQGFYAAGTVDALQTPDSCITCAMVQGPHILVPLQQDYFFDIDFQEELARHGRVAPRYIESISLVFSGHTYQVEVGDVALLAEE